MKQKVKGKLIFELFIRNTKNYELEINVIEQMGVEVQFVLIK